jgi:hypothetical protein
MTRLSKPRGKLPLKATRVQTTLAKMGDVITVVA